MGARIESAAALRARRGPLAGGALHLADTAARDCLARAGRHAEEIELLVNAGLYKDHNLAEPALASIIQEDIGANPGHPPRRRHHGTFSFDVLNGGCGVLSALQLVDAFVGPGTAQLGLVVAADSDPERRYSRGFGFPPVGGAVLLGHGDGPEGFERFSFKSFPEDAGLFEVRVLFDPKEGRHGQSLLEVHEDPRFAARCLEHAAGVTLGFMDAARLRPADVDLLIASPYPPGFAVELASAVHIHTDRLPELPAALTGAHTAGPIAVLTSAIDSGRLAQARNVLFVAVGAGITVGVALYRR
jgi:3-oxoacyl-[acyl-carrier-protein] synthase III